jgi:hypothetical protein
MGQCTHRYRQISHETYHRLPILADVCHLDYARLMFCVVPRQGNGEDATPLAIYRYGTAKIDYAFRSEHLNLQPRGICLGPLAPTACLLLAQAWATSTASLLETSRPPERTREWTGFECAIIVEKLPYMLCTAFNAR